MVCLRNISVDTLHKGDTGDDDDDNDDDDNNNNYYCYNNNNYYYYMISINSVFGRNYYCGLSTDSTCQIPSISPCRVA
jgi:hypothetical protein